MIKHSSLAYQYSAAAPMLLLITGILLTIFGHPSIPAMIYLYGGAAVGVAMWFFAIPKDDADATTRWALAYSVWVFLWPVMLLGFVNTSGLRLYNHYILRQEMTQRDHPFAASPPVARYLSYVVSLPLVPIDWLLVAIRWMRFSVTLNPVRPEPALRISMSCRTNEHADTTNTGSAQHDDASNGVSPGA